MKINNNTPGHGLIEKAKVDTAQEILTGKAKTGQEPIKENGGSRSGASVEISDNARLMQKAMQAARSAPNARAEKVAQLKKGILEGSYKVDSAKVADRLVDEHLGTDFGKNSL